MENQNCPQRCNKQDGPTLGRELLGTFLVASELFLGGRCPLHHHLQVSLSPCESMLISLIPRLALAFKLCLPFQFPWSDCLSVWLAVTCVFHACFCFRITGRRNRKLYDTLDRK